MIPGGGFSGSASSSAAIGASADSFGGTNVNFGGITKATAAPWGVIAIAVAVAFVAVMAMRSK